MKALGDVQEEVAEGSVQVCVYCQNPCEADLFAQEPVWSCAWCRATAHVRCFHAFHTDPGSAAVSEAETAAEIAKDRVNSSSEAGPLSTARLSPRIGLDDLSGHHATPRRNGRYLAQTFLISLAGTPSSCCAWSCQE